MDTAPGIEMVQQWMHSLWDSPTKESAHWMREHRPPEPGEYSPWWEIEPMYTTNRVNEPYLVGTH